MIDLMAGFELFFFSYKNNDDLYMFVSLLCSFIFRVFYPSGKTAKMKYAYKFVFISTSS